MLFTANDAAAPSVAPPPTVAAPEEDRIRKSSVYLKLILFDPPATIMNKKRYFPTGLDHLIMTHCDACDEKSSYVRHRQNCQTCRTSLTYFCQRCNASYNYIGPTHNHMMRQHLMEAVRDSHSCPRCGREFPTEDLKHLHQQKCFQIGIKKCDHCDFKTHEKDILIGHLRLQHPEIAEKQRNRF